MELYFPIYHRNSPLDDPPDYEKRVTGKSIHRTGTTELRENWTVEWMIISHSKTQFELLFLYPIFYAYIMTGDINDKYLPYICQSYQGYILLYNTNNYLYVAPLLLNLLKWACDRHHENLYNGSVLKNPEISGAIFTLNFSILILNSQCVEGARNFRVL